MNDRIRELEAQCWVQIPCDFDMMSDGLSTIRTVFDREKFAELIIGQCIEVAQRERNPQNLNYKPSERFVESLKLHFNML